MAPRRPGANGEMVRMVEWLLNPETWIALLSLLALEIVLNIDNVIFLSIITSRLPPERQPLARKIGLGLALLFRIIFLVSITWIIGLTAPAFQIWHHDISWRDLILLSGGLFLLWKATEEIYREMEGRDADPRKVALKAAFGAVIVQIVLIDLVFSLDSILTAIGLVRDLAVMIVAVVISIVVMLAAAGPIGDFVHRHPSVKMLALAFLLMIGVALVADSFHVDIPRGYLYFGIAFSMAVETLNLLAARRRKAGGAAR
jgi:predicted tellurium resistance membrane protein TerC